MPYGYIGQNLPNQTKSNSGVFSISDVADLEKQGKFGGSLELIEEQTFSSSSGVDFTSIQENKYDVHLLQYNIDLVGYRQLYLRFYESGVLETASVYGIAQQRGRSNGTFDEVRNTSTGEPYIIASSNTNQSVCFYMYFYNLGDSTKYSFSSSHSSFLYAGTNDEAFMFGSSVLPQASTVDGIRIQSNANTFTGTLSLYGIRYS